GVQNWGVLHWVRKSGLVLAKIDLLIVSLILVDANVEAEESPFCRGGDIDVENTVTHLEILQHGRAAVDREALAAEIVRYFGPLLEVPARGVRRDGECLRSLTDSGEFEENGKSSDRERTGGGVHYISHL